MTEAELGLLGWKLLLQKGLLSLLESRPSCWFYDAFRGAIVLPERLYAETPRGDSFQIIRYAVYMHTHFSTIIHTTIGTGKLGIPSALP